jgi:hypothetical protein
MPNRDRDKESPHEGSGSRAKSARGQKTGQDRPRDSEGHFTGGKAEDSHTGSRSEKSDDDTLETEEQ